MGDLTSPVRQRAMPSSLLLRLRHHRGDVYPFLPPPGTKTDSRQRESVAVTWCTKRTYKYKSTVVFFLQYRERPKWVSIQIANRTKAQLRKDASKYAFAVCGWMERRMQLEGTRLGKGPFYATMRKKNLNGCAALKMLQKKLRVMQTSHHKPTPRGWGLVCASRDVGVAVAVIMDYRRGSISDPTVSPSHRL